MLCFGFYSCMKWSESCSVVSNSLWPHGLCSPWNSPGRNTGVGSLSLHEGIFPTQDPNTGLLHCRQILSWLSHQGLLGIHSYVDGYMLCLGFCACGGYYREWRTIPFVTQWVLVIYFLISSVHSVQSLSRVWLFVTPWITAHQASLSITNSHSLLGLISIKSVMLSNHLILCLPPLLLPSIFPIIRVFYSESVLRIR